MLQLSFRKSRLYLCVGIPFLRQKFVPIFTAVALSPDEKFSALKFFRGGLQQTVSVGIDRRYILLPFLRPVKKVIGLRRFFGNRYIRSLITGHLTEIQKVSVPSICTDIGRFRGNGNPQAFRLRNGNVRPPIGIFFFYVSIFYPRMNEKELCPIRKPNVQRINNFPFPFKFIQPQSAFPVFFQYGGKYGGTS